MIETVCIAWFTLEYFIRLAGAPDKWAFLKDGMNIVDVLAILPFFVTLFFMGPSTPEMWANFQIIKVPIILFHKSNVYMEVSDIV